MLQQPASWSVCGEQVTLLILREILAPNFAILARKYAMKYHEKIHIFGDY